jgi:hypothetical protein
MLVLLSTDERASVAEVAEGEVEVGTYDALPVPLSYLSRALLHFNIIFIHITAGLSFQTDPRFVTLNCQIVKGNGR